MARPRKSGNKELLSKHLPRLRVTEMEYEKIVSDAKMRDLSVSDWLRILIYQNTPKHRLKKLQLIDTAIVSELSRQGGNLRNLFKEYSRGIRAFPADESRAVLHNIDEIVMYIRRVYERYLEKELGGFHDRQGHHEE